MATYLKALVLLVVGVGLAVGALELAPRIPGFSYDVDAFFAGSGGPARYAAFAVFVLWTGMSGAIVGFVSARTGYTFLVMPALVAVAGALGYALLMAGVGADPIVGLVGAPRLAHVALAPGLLEDLRRTVVAEVPSPAWLDALETAGRWIALSAPLVLSLAIFDASFERLAVWRRRETFRYFLAYGLVHFILMAPWFVLCRLVVLNLAATDTVTALLAGPYVPGIGGELLVFLFVVLVALNATLLARASAAGLGRFAIVLGGSLVVAPLGWVLLRMGLAGPTGGAGAMATAIDRLFVSVSGDPRSLALSVLGGAAVQLGLVAVFAWGQRIARPRYHPVGSLPPPA